MAGTPRTTSHRCDVEEIHLPSIELCMIPPEHPVWMGGESEIRCERGAFIWLTPPPGVDPTSLAELLRKAGYRVKVNPPIATDAAVPEEVARIPVNRQEDVRAVVAEMARAADRVAPGAYDRAMGAYDGVTLEVGA